jgi:thiol-disulfide isomerase/thioredoxin
MKQFLLFITLFTATLVWAGDTGIEFFHGTFEEAKAKAEKENKLLFIDCYTVWCGPCKMLAKTVFTQPEMGKFFNENFINVKLDMEKEGVGFGAEYGINAYPTLIYMDHMGNVKQRVVGGRSAEGFIEAGKEAMKPDPAILRKMDARFENGEREKAFLMGYITELSKAQKSYEVPYREYNDLFGNNKEAGNGMKDISFQIANHISSSATKIVVENRDYFIEKNGKDKYQKTVEKINNISIKDAIKNKDALMYGKVQEFVKAAKFDNAKQQINENEMQWYESAPDWIKYATSMNNYIKKFIPKDTTEIAIVVTKFVKNCNNEKAFQTAEKSIKTMVKVKPNYDNHLIAAKAYVKMRKNDKAMEHLQKAKAAANGEDTNEAEDFIKRLKGK